MIKSSFKYGDHTIPMFLGYKLALNKLQDLDLNIFTVMTTGEAMQDIHMNDEKMLKVWFFYLEEHFGKGTVTFDEALEVLDDSPTGLKPFKDAFWKMVVGFMPPEAREPLELQLTETMKRLKSSVREKLKTSFSDLSDSQE